MQENRAIHAKALEEMKIFQSEIPKDMETIQAAILSEIEAKYAPALARSRSESRSRDSSQSGDKDRDK